MTQATILNTPASYGAEYVTDGTRYQLTSIRGEASVRFSFQHGGRWHTQRIEAPERFGAVPIANGKAWRAWVAAWLDAGTIPAYSDRS